MPTCVMVIDDSPTVRHFLRSILEEHGYEVIEAGDGREALDVLERHERVTLALVDWIMPEMDGVEFVRHVRADSRYDKLRLMMVTSLAEPANVADALEAGADEYVMKPFTKEALLQKLEILGLGNT